MARAATDEQFEPLAVDSSAPRAPAGWYPDPERAATQRYWDGTRWTDDIAPFAESKSTAAEGAAISTTRAIALVAGVAVVIGSIGPWSTTFIGDVSGTDGDGVITLIFAAVAILLVMTRNPGSRWLLVATTLGILCAFIGIADIIDISGSHQEVFAQDVHLVSTGWGIWLMTIAAGVFTVASYWYRAETPRGGAS